MQILNDKNNFLKSFSKLLKSIKFSIYRKVKKIYHILKHRDFRKKYNYIPRKLFSFFYDNMRIVQLAVKLDVSFIIKENSLIAQIPIYETNIMFILDKHVCFQLLEEQFLKRSPYNFIFDKSIIAIDIGMNVGDTSLFFAANPYIKKVYSYELMPQIYDRAIQNFRLNYDLSDKIKANNYGLGKCDYTLEVPYYEDFDIGNGLFNDVRREMFGKAILTTCKIKNVVTELRKIVQEHPDESLYLKIDAEGAEYDIVNAVFQNPLSANIYYVALEYHFGVQDLIKVLKTSNFEVIESLSNIDSGDDNNKVGTIQAIRKIKS